MQTYLISMLNYLNILCIWYLIVMLYKEDIKHLWYESTVLLYLTNALYIYQSIPHKNVSKDEKIIVSQIFLEWNLCINWEFLHRAHTYNVYIINMYCCICVIILSSRNKDVLIIYNKRQFLSWSILAKKFISDFFWNLMGLLHVWFNCYYWYHCYLRGLHALRFLIV